MGIKIIKKNIYSCNDKTRRGLCIPQRHLDTSEIVLFNRNLYFITNFKNIDSNRFYKMAAMALAKIFDDISFHSIIQ